MVCVKRPIRVKINTSVIISVISVVLTTAVVLKVKETIGLSVLIVGEVFPTKSVLIITKTKTTSVREKTKVRRKNQSVSVYSSVPSVRSYMINLNIICGNTSAETIGVRIVIVKSIPKRDTSVI